MPIVVQISIAVVSLALVAVAIALIQTITQLRSTAAQVERTMARLDTAIPEIERTVVEARGVLDTLGQVSSRVDRLAGEFAETGSRVARVSSLFVNEVIEPAAQVAALVKGVRAGASSLAGTLFKRRSARWASVNHGGNHDE